MTPNPINKWHCNKCGHDFCDAEAEGVDVAPDCDERAIACPKCWANNIEEENALTPPDSLNTEH